MVKGSQGQSATSVIWKKLYVLPFAVIDKVSVTLTRGINYMFALQLKTVGSNVLFAAVTEISDSVLKGAEASGFDGMVLIYLLPNPCEYFPYIFLFIHGTNANKKDLKIRINCWKYQH